MSEQKLNSIIALLNSFPQTTGDLELAMETYLAVLRDYDDVHVAQATGRFLRGEVPGANPRFAPSTAELAIEVRAARQREYDLAERAKMRAKYAPEIRALQSGKALPPDTPPHRAQIARLLIEGDSERSREAE